LILHREALYRAYLDTEIASAAFETVNLPFFAILGNRNSIGGATPPTKSAEDASIDVNFHPPPGDRCKGPFLLRIHERRRPVEQVPDHGFCHRK
jgi:hypothetical protein